MGDWDVVSDDGWDVVAEGPSAIAGLSGPSAPNVDMQTSALGHIPGIASAVGSEALGVGKSLLSSNPMLLSPPESLRPTPERMKQSPVLGKMLNAQFAASDAMKPKEGEKIGYYATEAAQLAGLGKLATPSKVISGARLGEVRAAIPNVAVDVKDVAPTINRIKELSRYGHGPVPEPVKALIRKNKIDFSSARDIYSAASEMLANPGSMSATMHRELTQFVEKFGNSISKTAEAGGQQPKFSMAMKQYSQAASLQKGLKTALKAAPYVGGTGLLGKYLLDKFGANLPGR